jgi:hypothetical protein
MSTHVMLDLETFGKTPGHVIRSFGAVAFDPVKGTLGETFYANVDRASCEAIGLIVDPGTEAWWTDQGDAAREVLEPNQVSILDVLQAFADCYKATGARRLWAHGAPFDPPFVEATYRAAGLEAPWKYYAVRDTRTIYDLADVEVDRDKGIHHFALDDAINQAEAVIEAYRRLKLTRRSLGRRLADALEAFREVRL